MLKLYCPNGHGEIAIDLPSEAEVRACPKCGARAVAVGPKDSAPVPEKVEAVTEAKAEAEVEVESEKEEKATRKK